jgi:hypothetical protein
MVWRRRHASGLLDHLTVTSQQGGIRRETRELSYCRRYGDIYADGNGVRQLIQPAELGDVLTDRAWSDDVREFARLGARQQISQRDVHE